MSAAPLLAAEMPVPELVDLMSTVTSGFAWWYAVAHVWACGASRLLPVSEIVADEAASTAAPGAGGRAGRVVLAHAAISTAVPAAVTAYSAAVNGRDLCLAYATVRPLVPAAAVAAAESTGYAAIVTGRDASGGRQKERSGRCSLACHLVFTLGAARDRR